MGPNEQTLVTNSFGVVTSKRVVYNAARGWFGGGSREDIPLQHVTSVRLENSRTTLGVILGILLLLTGVVMMSGGNFGTGIVLLGIALLLLWGSPSVAVNTAGQDRKAAKGAPWQKAEASAFVEALRGQLFKE